MTLSPAEKKRLRGIGHRLPVVVRIGDKGLTDNLVGELERALHDHELVKIQAEIPDRRARRETIELLGARCEAELVQVLGKTALLYRRNPKPDPRLSNLLRRAR